MESNKFKILITGSSGFIGKNLVEYFTKKCVGKYSLFYPYHSELELLNAQQVSEYISENNIDIIIHNANIGGSRKTDYDAGKTDIAVKNLRMFFNLIHSINPAKRMFFLGTGAEYDICHYKPRMSEDYFDIHIPEDPYGFSKYVCSKYIENCKNIINLRLFGVFGKYEGYEYRFISNAIVKNLLGFPIVINQNVRFDYLYINDLVQIIERFIKHKSKYNFYNVVTGKTIDLITIANKINEISGKTSEIIVKNSGLNIEYSGDNSRLLEELNGFDFTPFDQALSELCSWYKANLDRIDRKAILRDDYLKYCRAK